MWDLLRRLVYFAPDGGAGAGGGAGSGDGGAGAGDGSNDADKDANDGGSQKSGEEKSGKDKEPSVEDQVQRRLNELLPDRAQQYLRSKILEPLGFKSEKELKDAVGELKKRKDDEKSDLEKAQERLTELETANTQKDKALKDTRLSHQVERLATKLKFHKPDLAHKLIQDQLANIEFGDDGEAKGLEDILKKLAKDNPFLIDNGQKPDIDGRTNTQKDKEPDAENLKRRFGI